MIKHKRRHSAPPFDIDETVCEAVCQHPTCWKSTRRLGRGLPRKLVRLEKQDSSGDEDTGLPSQKVFNILDEFGPDVRDRFPSKYSGLEQHQRTGIRHTRPRPPNVTPASSFINNVEPKPLIKSVEVQELFEFGDLHPANYGENFVNKPVLVWVPNEKKQMDKVQKKEQLLQDLKAKMMQAQMSRGPKDVTEQLVPREIEEQREREILQKQILKSAATKPATIVNMQPYYYKATPPRTPRSPGPGRVFELMNFSRSDMLKIMEHVEKYDLTSKEQIYELIQQLTPENLTQKTKAQFALVGNEIMTQRKTPQQKKAPATVNTAPPVFHLDSGLTKEESADMNLIDEYPRYKKPLPSIPRETPGNSHVLKKRVISLGLPELPPGVQATRPFQYNNKDDLNFVLEAHSQSSVRPQSSQSGYSQGSTTQGAGSSRGESPDHMREDTLERMYIKQYRKNLQMGKPLHAMSPSNSTNVPNTPMGTPVVKTPTTTFLEKMGEIVLPRTVGLQEPSQSSQVRSPMLSRDVSGMEPIAEFEVEAARSPSTYVLQGTGITASTPSSPQKHPGVPLDRSPSLHLPQSRKSVRFAPGVKPSSPTCIVTPTTSSPSPAKKAGGETRGPNRMGTDGSNDANANKSPKSDPDPETIKIPTVPNTPVVVPISPDVPEEWPQVNEEDYDITPEPRPMRLLGSGYDHPDSKLANFDSRSVKSSTSSHQRSNESRESLRSELNRKRLAEASPGPPPPSPEPKDEASHDSLDVSDIAEMRRDFSTVSNATMTPLIEEAYESDGEISLSADPPSRIMSADSVHAREKMLNNVNKMDEIIDTWEDSDEKTFVSDKLDESTMREIEEDLVSNDNRITLSALPPDRLLSTEVSPVPSLDGGDEREMPNGDKNNNFPDDGQVLPSGEQDNVPASFDENKMEKIDVVNGTQHAAESCQNLENDNEGSSEANVINNENLSDPTITADQSGQEVRDNDVKDTETIVTLDTSAEGYAVIEANTTETTIPPDQSGHVGEIDDVVSDQAGVDPELNSALEKLDMGEDGGDHEGFKEELREELRKMEEQN